MRWDKTNPAYKEILKLHEALKAAGIPHTMERRFDGWQICYYGTTDCTGNVVSDVIEHYASYGASADTLEICGLLTPEEREDGVVCGGLTAEDVFQRYKEHWEGRK